MFERPQSGERAILVQAAADGALPSREKKATVARAADGDRHGFTPMGQLESSRIDSGRIETERKEKEIDKREREIAHHKAFVERFRAKATKARQAQSRLKALERMETIAPAHVDSPFHFSFRPPLKNPHPLITLDGCAAGYAGKAVIGDASLALNPGDRVGLLGPNGAGKSTLIKLLAGALAPLEGQRTAARHLAIGYFAQHQLEQLQPGHSPLEHLQQMDPQASEQSTQRAGEVLALLDRNGQTGRGSHPAAHPRGRASRTLGAGGRGGARLHRSMNVGSRSMSKHISATSRPPVIPPAGQRMKNGTRWPPS